MVLANHEGQIPSTDLVQEQLHWVLESSAVLKLSSETSYRQVTSGPVFAAFCTAPSTAIVQHLVLLQQICTMSDIISIVSRLPSLVSLTCLIHGPTTQAELIPESEHPRILRERHYPLSSNFRALYVYSHSYINGKPDYVRKQVNVSLKRLGIDKIDLYYQHRVDPNTPIEDTVGAMAGLVKEGKIRFIGLSECTADQLRHAYKVHPIAAVQVEYSPWTTHIETDGLLDACRKLGVTVVAYSPLGRGFMTGQIHSIDDLDKDDWRRTIPRFKPEHFANNLKLVDEFEDMAKKRGCKPGQIALAWLLAQEKNLVVIPGTKRIKYLDENLGAGQITLTEEENKTLRGFVDAANIQGERY
ncbi:hypothetical protein H4S04_004680 [Coemansia sp. S16]|nr:hypothetical protein H4S04_004680 [Coemansia sp. S16]